MVLSDSFAFAFTVPRVSVLAVVIAVFYHCWPDNAICKLKNQAREYY